MRVYLACGLTHVPRAEFADYVARIHALAASLSSTAVETKYALRDSDPRLSQRPKEERARLCYIWDREMVEWADAVVADATYPSIGLGIELQIAAQAGKPLVLSFHQADAHRAAEVEYNGVDHRRHSLQIGEGYVSLMALGLPTVFTVIRYHDTTDCIDQVRRSILMLRPPTT